MLATLDVLFAVLKTFFSCLINPKKRPKRSWRGEFIARLAKSLLTRSIGKDFDWIRARQNVLTLYSPDLFKVRSTKIEISGVPCINISPKTLAEPEKVVLYFHGGGYGVGSARGYQLMGAKLALMCHAKVVLVGYRLIPEHPLPAAQEDCYAVTVNVLKQSAQKKVILMGDSAGGALCLSTLKRIHAASEQSQIQDANILASVLISPWVAPLSYQNLSLENEPTDMIDRHITQYWVDTFCQTEHQKAEVDFSDITTLGFRKEDWPRLYIQAAGAEVFLKQVKMLSKQLNDAEIEHDFDIFSDQFHVFQTFSPLIPEAKEALKGIADFVQSV